MTGWHVLLLPALSLLVALVELDNVHVGQWMVSRPIVLGPVLGLACGAPALGLAAGALVECFCIDVLPVGAALPVNGAIAVAVFLLLASGPDAVPAAAAFPAGLALGSVFRRVENAVRGARSGLARGAEEALEEGRPARLGSALARGILWHAAATGAFVYVGVAALGPALGWGWASAPLAARRGLDLAYMNAPWLGLAALLYSLRPRA